eukprot:95691-Alexandrium_andersonii.AAC.1
MVLHFGLCFARRVFVVVTQFAPLRRWGHERARKGIRILAFSHADIHRTPANVEHNKRNTTVNFRTSLPVASC